MPNITVTKKQKSGSVYISLYVTRDGNFTSHHLPISEFATMNNMDYLKQKILDIPFWHDHDYDFVIVTPEESRVYKVVPAYTEAEDFNENVRFMDLPNLERPLEEGESVLFVDHGYYDEEKQLYVEQVHSLKFPATKQQIDDFVKDFEF